MTNPYIASVVAGADTKHTCALTRARVSAAGPRQPARAEGKKKCSKVQRNPLNDA